MNGLADERAGAASGQRDSIIETVSLFERQIDRLRWSRSKRERLNALRIISLLPYATEVRRLADLLAAADQDDEEEAIHLRLIVYRAEMTRAKLDRLIWELAKRHARLSSYGVLGELWLRTRDSGKQGPVLSENLGQYA